MGTERANDATETEIDASGHECRCDGEAHNLHEEAILRPLVLPRHYSSNVSQYLQESPSAESKCESVVNLRAPPPSNHHRQKVHEKAEGEECEESGVGADGNTIVVEGGVDGTFAWVGAAVHRVRFSFLARQAVAGVGFFFAFGERIERGRDEGGHVAVMVFLKANWVTLPEFRGGSSYICPYSLLSDSYLASYSELLEGRA